MVPLMKAAYYFFVNVCKLIGQVASFLLETIDDLDRRRAYSKRRRVASYMVPLRLQREWIREGISGNQLYYLGIAKRRTYRIQEFRRFSIFWLVVLVACLLGPPASGFFSTLGRFPIVPYWVNSTLGATAAMGALAALVERCKANSRANRGSELAVLALDTVDAVELVFGGDQPPGSGLAPGGSRHSSILGTVRRRIKEDCWKITLWTADFTGRSRQDFASASVSSFPRIILWATSNPSPEKIILLSQCAFRFVRMIDACNFDFEFPEASDAHRQTPQIKKPSILVKLRSKFSFKNVSTAIAIAAGIATILTYFKVPPAMLKP